MQKLMEHTLHAAPDGSSGTEEMLGTQNGKLNVLKQHRTHSSVYWDNVALELPVWSGWRNTINPHFP